MTRYLILPGWQGSGPEHWQTHWQRRLPDARRVEQDDWQRPDPQRWVAALDAAIAQANAPVVLIAHSLGCVTVARWAASAPVARRQRVLAALLVAPADVERPGCPTELVDFAPLPRQPLPFPSRIVTSDNDHAISLPRAEALAQAWGSELDILPGAGHINTRSGHRQWEEGLLHLAKLESSQGLRVA
ncbi:MAG: alpha/beta hydrolase [Pseudomonas sp. PGPPP4]|uniref:RBBP9/YdeN family alpha/beta hydrolase n=1 Tax=Pseudomonas sp. PGPPP4 TaxID=2015556 RepID=UPI000BC668C1|nr:alpha/beta hydrolase [Pseudomonas sp. PGPPP4]OYT78742.1 MAG: alpha/beta hydrolase [Pseudomonas sp. PGPPP4]